MKKVIILIVVFLLFSCREASTNADNNRKQLTVTNKDTSVLNREINMMVISDDEKALKFFNLLSYDEFFGGKPSDYSKSNSGTDTLVITINSIDTPQIIEFQSYGEQFYKSRIFVTPGDNILLEIKNEKLKFKGDSPAHYAFFHQLDSLDHQWSKIGYSGNVSDYKRKADSLYKNNEDFFNSYVKNHEVSEEFIQQVNSELEFEYKYNLIAPRTIKSSTSEARFNDIDGPLNMLQKNINREGDQSFFDYRSYFGDVEIDTYQENNFVYNDYYKRSLTLYIRHYFVNHSYLNFSLENYNDEIQYITENLNGESKHYAQIKLMKDYYEKGFGRDRYNSDVLKQDIEKLKAEIKKPSYLAELNDLSSELEFYDSKVPQQILEEELLNIKGDTVKFGDILNIKDNLKLFQFWAYKDRCTICADGILQLDHLKRKGNVPTDLNIVYISINRDPEKWAEEVNFFKDQMDVTKNYMILQDNMQSELLAYFRVRKDRTIELPRYLILNNKREVLLNTIPLPADSIAFKKTLQRLPGNKIKKQ